MAVYLGNKKVNCIGGIVNASSDTSDATATAEDILLPKTAYVDGNKITGTMVDRGTVNTTLDTTTTSHTIAEGKHSGSGKVSITLQEKSVSPSTSAQTVVPDSGKVLSKVNVAAMNLQSKTVEPSATSQDVSADSGYDALKKVTVNPITLQEKSVSPSTSAQTVVPDSGYDGLSQVVVNATDTVKLQSKSVSPTTSSQIVKPDSGYDGLSQVSVGAIATGSLSTPSISVSSGGVITATGGVSSSGYISSETTKSNTYSMSTQAGKTVTPSTSTQTAVSSGRYTTGTVYVAGDSNLIASNIKSGVSIFGVSGNYSGGEGYITDGVYFSTIHNASTADGSCIVFDLSETDNVDNMIGVYIEYPAVSNGLATGMLISAFVDIEGGTVYQTYATSSTTVSHEMSTGASIVLEGYNLYIPVDSLRTVYVNGSYTITPIYKAQ